MADAQPEAQISDLEQIFNGNQLGSQFILALKKFLGSYIGSIAVSSLVAGSNITITSTTGKITISSSGGGTSTNASGPGTDTTISGANTPAVIPIASASFTNGITYDSTNKRFVTVTAGKYIALGAAYYASPGAAQVRSLIYINGSLAKSAFGFATGSGTIVQPQASALISLSVGDYVELWGETSGSSASVTGANSYLDLAKV